jgi:hypothetical protein
MTFFLRTETLMKISFSSLKNLKYWVTLNINWVLDGPSALCRAIPCYYRFIFLKSLYVIGSTWK